MCVCFFKLCLSCLGWLSRAHPLAGRGAIGLRDVGIAEELSVGRELATVGIWELRPRLAALTLASVLGEGREPPVCVCVCVCGCVCVCVCVCMCVCACV